jgi:mono/diheme cytochrome c family protein
MLRISAVAGLILLSVIASASEIAAETLDSFQQSAAHRGYDFLVNKSYLSPDFDQQTFDEVWKVWPEPLRTDAEKATPEQRRRMAFSRYGLTERPGDDSGKPLQYVVDERGNWVMNCFACHAGKVAGQIIAGLPNTHFALQTLSEEIRSTKLRLEKPLGRMDIGSAFIPLGNTNGTTNAVMFGVVLLALRDADLNFISGRAPPKMVHHDMDAPPWWNFKKRKRLYIDGFAEKNHRSLMQFMLIKQNGPEKFREWEADYRDVYAYMESLEPPKYPFAIDHSLAAAGEEVFNNNCAHCHGTYGRKETYPHSIVPIDEVGTDRVRLDALTRAGRQHYARSWFAHNGKENTLLDPGGYVAPPLDGIWASAPYFHNGSVPTLWHVLHPSQRPVVWQRTEDGYDREKVGLEIETFDQLPTTIKSSAQRRQYFDTRNFGKSAAGHLFPDELDEDEKQAVLEYLKTL